MKGYIDRIEDKKFAVINIIGGGEMIIPVKQFKFKIHEGMHLEIDFKPKPEEEKKTLDRIKKLQQELLKRSKNK